MVQLALESNRHGAISLESNRLDTMSLESITINSLKSNILDSIRSEHTLGINSKWLDYHIFWTFYPYLGAFDLAPLVFRAISSVCLIW